MNAKKTNRQDGEWRDRIQASREMVLANLSMISQIPAQTFHERERSEFAVSRFAESGVPSPKADKLHNAIGAYDASSRKNTILVCTHMDNQFDSSSDQNISITENKAYGAGVADDNIALAVLLTLPDIISRLGIELESNLMLLATTRYHGRGDFGGMRHFIRENKNSIGAAVNLSGIPFGSLNYFALSRSRCDIHCEVNSRLGHMGDANAILAVSDMIESLFAIPLPKKPRTTLNIGMISGGERYSTPSREASIHIEALSEDDEIMNNITEEISDRCTDVAAKHGVLVETDFFGRHKASAMTSSHPLVKSAMTIIKELGATPQIEYSNSEISVLLAEEIPSVGIGLTTGTGGSGPKSHIDIPPLSKGIFQFITLLTKIDREISDYEKA